MKNTKTTKKMQVNNGLHKVRKSYGNQKRTGRKGVKHLKEKITLSRSMCMCVFAESPVTIGSTWRTRRGFAKSIVSVLRASNGVNITLL